MDNSKTILRREVDQALPRWLLPSPVHPDKIIRIWDNYGDVRNCKKGWYAHCGIDITAREGTPLYCVDRSVVKSRMESNRGHGNRIELKIIEGPFRDYKYMLCHCLSIADLGRGDVVERDVIVARVGESGNATGPHLHLALGSNLGFNGYARTSYEAMTRGFCDPAGLFDFGAARWSK